MVLLFGHLVHTRRRNGFCEYRATSNVYDCSFSAELFKRERDIDQINGTHLDGFNDSNVSGLVASFGSIIPVTPTIICENYENLQALLLIGVRLHLLTENSFSQCHNLRTLYITFNRIRAIPINAFRNNVQLKELYMQGNEIVHIEDLSFRNLVNLEILELNQNRIIHISETTFRGLVNVQNLALQNNQIVELSSNMFSKLKDLAWLTLFSNRISRIHPDFLTTLPNSTFRLDLVNNQCINNWFTYSVEIIDDLENYFEACFANYRSIESPGVSFWE